MTGRFRSLMLLALALAIPACASGRGGKSSSNPNLLTEEEIVAAGYTDAYSTIQALRPNWLLVRGATTFGSPHPIRVYLDEQRYGGVDALKNISTQQVGAMRYYNGIQASERWGLDNGGGAIQVVTRRGR